MLIWAIRQSHFLQLAPAVPWPGLNGAGSAYRLNGAGAPWFAHEPRHQDAAG